MSETCSTCGQEIRFGVRNPTPQWPGPRWLHRDPADDADHIPTHGTLIGTEGWAAIEANKNAMVAERKGKKDSKAADEEEDNEPVIVDLPEPEIRATPIPVTDLPPRSGIRQVANLIEKTDGWTLRTLTRSRGPYVGARGQVLSISDMILIRASGEEVDGVRGNRRFVVASWRDGKFDFAYVGTIAHGVAIPRAANATELKAWIRGGV